MTLLNLKGKTQASGEELGQGQVGRLQGKTSVSVAPFAQWARPPWRAPIQSRGRVMVPSRRNKKCKL